MISRFLKVNNHFAEWKRLSDLPDKFDTVEREIAHMRTTLIEIGAELAATRITVETLQLTAEPQTTPHIIAGLTSAGLSARAARLAAGTPPLAKEALHATPQLIVEEMERLRELKPDLFPVWKRLFDNSAQLYYEEKQGSCSHREHPYALMFGYYLEIHARGRILDVGCGPHGIPSYLAMRDSATISGLDPLPCVEPPDFEFVQGFNEFLPWPDAGFDTVVSGTSLDHVLSLDRSLAEVRRVLKPDGLYLVWLASVPGASPFDDTAADWTPIDEFHLFHFDRAWVEPFFSRHFGIEDVTILSQPGFDHVFYRMRSRPPDRRS